MDPLQGTHDQLQSNTVSIQSPTLRALISSESPLLFSPTTFEPYLPFPSTSTHFSNFRLTPSRLSDLEAQVCLFNSPSVTPWTLSAPRPYTSEFGKMKIESAVAESLLTLLEWRKVGSESRRGRIGVPVTVLRDGEEGEMVGSIHFGRHALFKDLEDLEERERQVELNKTREWGDPELVMTMGFYLQSDFSGKGLMTEALQLVRSEYLIPVLNCEHIKSAAFQGNFGSRAVHLKAGFKHLKDGEVRMPEDKGGEMKAEWTFEWRKGYT